MAENIIISNGEFSGTITTDGAWLESLTDGSGVVLFPHQSLEASNGSMKERGGCHVCLPNFGVAGDSGLAQHGFGRESAWTVQKQTDSSVVLELIGGAEGYQHLKSELRYSLYPAGIEMELITTNEGTIPLRVSPGFHPYFAGGSQTKQVSVDTNTYSVNDISGSVLLFDEPQELRLDSATYVVRADKLKQWVLWSDRLGDYVCLEPTQAGPSFVNEAAEDELLMGGQQKTWTFSITKKLV